MRLDAPSEISRLIDNFNNADDLSIQYALAVALREELMTYANTLDEIILPICQKAMIKAVKKD